MILNREASNEAFHYSHHCHERHPRLSRKQAFGKCNTYILCYNRAWLSISLIYMPLPLALHTLRLLRLYQVNPLQLCYLNTRSCVRGQESRVVHKYVSFTGTASLPFSTPRISITTGLISIRFTYFMLFIYTALHTKFERNQPSSSQDMCS